eukprot:jgi/Ulvmu1/5298/UM022_0092.1
MDFDDVTPMIQNIVIMDSEGKRIAVKYYNDEWNTVAAQANFEKDLFAKINRGQQRSLEGDVLLFDDVAVLYKRAGDLIIVVTGSQDENELILTAVLSGLSEALTILLRDVVNKKAVLENLDLVLITIDETVDQGFILEVDPQIIAQRVAMRPDTEADGGSAGYGEHTFSQALANARHQLARSLLS